MESSKEKNCPILSAPSSDWEKCVGEKCAFWCSFAQDCAVPLVAGILADSSINQVKWNGAVNNDRF